MENHIAIWLALKVFPQKLRSRPNPKTAGFQGQQKNARSTAF
jgi:hypothetical protein